MLLTFKSSRIAKIVVGDNTLDLVIYLWERGWPMPHNVVPKAVETGVNRRSLE